MFVLRVIALGALLSFLTASVQAQDATAPAPRCGAATTPSSPWAAAEGTLRVGGAVNPKQTKNVNPRYPRDAMSAGVQGCVRVELIVGPDGKVSDTRVTGGVPLLFEAALEAVRQWEFTPTVVDGKPASVFMFAELDFNLRPSPNAPAASLAPATPWPAAAGIARVGGAIQPPVQTKKVNPQYPLAAQLERVQGVVILEAIIGVDGRIREARVIRSLPFFDQAAIEAVRQWEYTPTQLDGKAVPIVMTVTVAFTMAPIPGEPVLSMATPLVVPPWPAAAGARRAGDDVPEPPRKKDARPKFPGEARARRRGGAVILELLIGADGKVADVRVIRSSPLFDKEAVKAARKWRYEPTLVNGVAVPVVMPATITFQVR